MHKLKLIMVLALATGAHAHAITVSETTACLTGMGAAAVAGGITYAALSKETPYWWAAAAPASLFTGWLTHKIFHNFTPEAKFAAAQSFMLQMSDNVIAHHSYANEQEIIDALHDIYIRHDLWLVRAYQDMATLIERIDYHLKNVQDACGARYGDHMFARICKELIKRFKIASKNFTVAIKVVKNHPEYMSQLTLYKEMLAKERELQAQQMMAYAQMQSAMAHTHAAYNNNRDRD